MNYGNWRCGVDWTGSSSYQLVDFGFSEGGVSGYVTATLMVASECTYVKFILLRNSLNILMENPENSIGLLSLYVVFVMYGACGKRECRKRHVYVTCSWCVSPVAGSSFSFHSHVFDSEISMPLFHLVYPVSPLPFTSWVYNLTNCSNERLV